jgi:hypothetical protein
MLLYNLAYSFILNMEAIYSFKTSLEFHSTIRSYIPENRNLHGDSCENLKSDIVY